MLLRNWVTKDTVIVRLKDWKGGINLKKNINEIIIDRDLVKEAGYYDAHFIDYLPPEKSPNSVGRVGIDLTKRYVITFKDIDELNKSVNSLLKKLIDKR